MPISDVEAHTLPDSPTSNQSLNDHHLDIHGETRPPETDDDSEFELSDLNLALEPELEIEDVVAQSGPSDGMSSVETEPLEALTNPESVDEVFLLDESYSIEDSEPQSRGPNAEQHEETVISATSDLGMSFQESDHAAAKNDGIEIDDELATEENRPLIVFSIDDQTDEREQTMHTLSGPGSAQLDDSSWEQTTLGTTIEMVNDTLESTQAGSETPDATDSITVASDDANADSYAESDGLMIEDVISDLGEDEEIVIDTIDETVETAESNGEPVAQAVKEPNAWELINAAARPAPKRPAVSPIRKIVPPILGGLAAFPIATLIMWYGFGKDLGSTGPTVARYVPWIVPQHLRGKGQRFTASPPKSLTTNNKPKSSSNNSNSGRPGTFGELGSNNNPSSSGTTAANVAPPSTISDSNTPRKRLPGNAATSSAVAKPIEEDKREPDAETTESRPPSKPSIASQSQPDQNESSEKAPVESTPSPTAETPDPSTRKSDTPSATAESENDNAVLPRSIQTIRDLKATWATVEKSTQQEKQDAVASLFDASRAIAQASSELKGRSSKVWRKEVDKVGKEILSTPIFRKAIDMCSTGLIKGISPPKRDEYATFVANVASFELDANKKLALKLSRPIWIGTNQIIPRLLPESTSSTPIPTITSPINCLLLGKITELAAEESDASSPENEKQLLLEVHLIVWPE